MKQIKIFDTTLRDGEQGIGCAMDNEQKLTLLEKLDSLGIDIIELGFPVASEEIYNFIKRAPSVLKNATAAVFSRLNETDIKIAVESVAGFNAPQIQLLGVGSEIHLHDKMRSDLKSVLDLLKKSIQQVKSYGVNNISVIFEDATRGSRELLKNSIDTAVENGVSTVVIADTLGCATPEELGKLFRWLRQITGDTITLSVHCHNDLGLATANTLAAVYHGADEVQTTLAGIGERAGNCPLEEVVAVLFYKSAYYQAETNIKQQLLYDAAQQMFTILGKKIAPNKPLIGDSVFSTAAGIHQNGLIKDPKIYEFVEPASFGRKREMLFNKLSGNAFLKHALHKFNITAQSLDKFYNFLIGFNREISESEVLALYHNFMNNKQHQLLETV